jgi:hypothetical protein
MTNTFNNMNNNINFSELSSRTSVQSLNKNNNAKFDNNNYYNKYNTINNNYRNNIHLKMRDDANKSYTENIKLMLKDQKGSKFIQKKIEEKSSDFLYKLYEQIKNNLFDIITDQYGNYVIQKFADNCDKKLLSKRIIPLKTETRQKSNVVFLNSVFSDNLRITNKNKIRFEPNKKLKLKGLFNQS